ncbi:MAG: hemolysin family protein [Vicinamibacterales bacterium]|nr:hemolysin family protein [Vicinamibacterales bacterium]
MMPLCLAALALVAFYLGTVGAAFASLMRLSLRLVAERTGRSSRMGVYLDDPVLLFLPVRAALGLVHVAMVVCAVVAFGLDPAPRLAAAGATVVVLIVVFEHLLPFAVVRKDPEHVLEVLLPSFDVVARILGFLLTPVLIASGRRGDRTSAGNSDSSEEEQQEATSAYFDAGQQEGLIEGDERRLLQSIVDFSDTLVKEVMTPRPDIVAIRSTATLGELRAFFREQEYSRIPVYTDSLDNIVGFVFIKDLMRLASEQSPDAPVSTLVRPAHVVPETKKVSDLLREFQRQQWQIAIVVDEYGGTAGLVTLEDLLEEIVGEIRDEYDVETEAVVEEPDGTFLVTGKADVHAVAERLGLEIEAEGFETFGGYVLSRLGRVPAMGEQFRVDKLEIDVLDAERRRVHRLRVRLVAEAEDTPVANGGRQPGDVTT